MDRKGISSPVFHDNDGANNYITKASIVGLQQQIQGTHSTLRARIENLSIDIHHFEARKRDYIDNKLSIQKEEQDARMEEIRTLLAKCFGHHHQGNGEQVNNIQSAQAMQAQFVHVHIHMATTIMFVIHIIMKGKSPPSNMCTTTMNNIYYKLKHDNDTIIMKMLNTHKPTSPNKLDIKLQLHQPLWHLHQVLSRHLCLWTYDIFAYFP